MVMVVFVIRIFVMLSLFMGLVLSLVSVLAIMIVVLFLYVRSVIMRLFRVIGRHLFFCPRIARRQQP